MPALQVKMSLRPQDGHSCPSCDNDRELVCKKNARNTVRRCGLMRVVGEPISAASVARGR